MINPEIFKYKCCYTCSLWKRARMLDLAVNPCTKMGKNTWWNECCQHYDGCATKDNSELNKELFAKEQSE